jgi:rhamnogalacturonyl hydrolase YesR
MRLRIVLVVPVLFAGPVVARATEVSTTPPAGDSQRAVPATVRQQAQSLQPAAIKTVCAAVADWQLAHPVAKRATTDWTYGAFFAGLSNWAATPGMDRCWTSLKDFGDKNQWQLGPRPYHADDHCVGQMYLAFYEKVKDPNMIKGLTTRFDWILANPSDLAMDASRQQQKDRWWWCDALFMAPPVWARLAAVTGQAKYLDFMDKEWQATTDFLYDKTEHLYFRDSSYFERREANGRKIFWSRGNGWVFAGLVRVLDAMPAGAAQRPRYVQLYRDMAAKLVTIQQPDGLWRSSLLDPNAWPAKETSGTGFFCYGLAWGINHGLLDPAVCRPAVVKAWQGLVGCVHEDGMLGSVQPIGAAPDKVSPDLTENYGAGAFLLAGSEVLKMASHF